MPLSATYAKKRNRKPVWAPKVLDKVYDLDGEGYSLDEIQDLLAKDERLVGLATPRKRTIQRLISERRQADTSGRWQFGAMADPDDERFVLQSLAAVVDGTAGRVRSVTKDEATWIARIRRARPDFTPWLAYRFARRYIERTAKGEPTEALDIQLAKVNPIVDAMTDEQYDRWASDERRPWADRVTKEDSDGEAR